MMDESDPVFRGLVVVHRRDRYCVALRCAGVAGFQVRHPNILSFLHSAEIETYDAGSPKVTIYIVTEPVMPLSEKIKELGLEGTQRYQLSNC